MNTLQAERIRQLSKEKAELEAELKASENRRIGQTAALQQVNAELEAKLAALLDVNDAYHLELQDAAVRTAKIAELEAKLAAAETCGLCGEHSTEENLLFICCENCTDIGVSNVPKEVFELQRQLAAEKERADTAERWWDSALEAGDGLARSLTTRLRETEARAGTAERQYGEIKRCFDTFGEVIKEHAPRDRWTYESAAEWLRGIIQRAEAAEQRVKEVQDAFGHLTMPSWDGGAKLLEENKRLRSVLQSIWNRCETLESFAGGVGSHEWLQDTVVSVGQLAQAALKPGEEVEKCHNCGSAEDVRCGICRTCFVG